MTESPRHQLLCPASIEFRPMYCYNKSLKLQLEKITMNKNLHYNRTYISTFVVDKGIDLYIAVALIGLDGTVISFSGLSILDRPLDFLKHLLIVRQLNLHLIITNKVASIEFRPMYCYNKSLKLQLEKITMNKNLLRTI
jgi:hypothetical protein